MKEALIRKYIIDIIFIVVVITLLTFLWFGPYQSKVRIRESLSENNISFNQDIIYNGFDYLNVTSKKTTKDLTITNNGDKKASFIINFDNSTGNNNYISYIIIDSEGYQSDVRNLSLDGYILENKIDVNETKTFKVIFWSDSKEIDGNLNILLNPMRA